jgi:hypothetical protein
MSVLYRGKQRSGKKGAKYRYFIGFFPSSVVKWRCLEALEPNFSPFLLPATKKTAPNGANFAVWRMPSRLPLEKLLDQDFKRALNRKRPRPNDARRALIVALFEGSKRKNVYKRIPKESPYYIRGQDTQARQLARGKVARARVAALFAV